MKTIIIQTLIPLPNIDPTKHKIYERCCSTIKRYAENIGSDYALETKARFPQLPPHFDIFRVFDEKRFTEYDNILFIDADVFALNTTENIFDYYSGFCACPNPGGKVTRREYKEFGNEFLNSGIVFIDQATISKLKPHYAQEMKACARIVPGRDQLALNRLAFKHLGGFNHIAPKHGCYLRDKESKEAILVHMAGRNRGLYLEDQQTWDDHFQV